MRPARDATINLLDEKDKDVLANVMRQQEQKARGNRKKRQHNNQPVKHAAKYLNLEVDVLEERVDWLTSCLNLKVNKMIRIAQQKPIILRHQLENTFDTKV